MPNVIQVSTAPGRGLRVEKVTPKMSRIVSPNREQIIFWSGDPVAAYDGSYLYLLNYTAASAKAELTKHWPDTPVLLQDITAFEFVLGQIISKAGLLMVRRLDP